MMSLFEPLNQTLPPLMLPPLLVWAWGYAIEQLATGIHAAKLLRTNSALPPEASDEA